MFCTKCGNKLEPEDKFCRACGSVINLQKEEAPIEKNQLKDSHTVGYIESEISKPADNTCKKKGYKNFIIFVIIAVLTAGGIFLCKSYYDNTPSRVVNKFVNAVNKKDLNTIISCLDPKYKMSLNDLKGTLSKTTDLKFSDVLDLLSVMHDIKGEQSSSMPNLKLKLTSVDSIDVNGNSATVKAEIEWQITDSSGKIKKESDQATFVLKQFNKAWKIVDLE